MLFIDARSGVIDATPSVRRATRRTPRPATSAGPERLRRGVRTATWDDLNANFTFPEQDVITRQRWFGGFKLRLSVLFLAAQVEIVPAGTSRDGFNRAGASIAAARQQTYSLSAGFDF